MIRDPSVGPNEPYWQTNTSFSPRPSTWDFRFQSEALSQSGESRNSLGENNLADHRFLVSDGVGPYFSSPPDISPAQQWTPPPIQEFSSDDYGTSKRDVVSRPLTLSPTMEGTSAAQYSRGSTPSQSDSSCDYESIANSHSSSCNFTTGLSFTSKPIHPFSFPSDFDARRDGHPLDSTSDNVNVTQTPLPLEYHLFTKSRGGSSDHHRCGLCERLISRKSPWNSRCDMPVAGVLACRHVFHAECLEQTTPKGRGNDPPCPVCAKIDEENSQECRVFSKLSKLTSVRSLHEEGPSKTWGCARAGDCVGGALRSPTRNKLMSLSTSRIRKNLLVKCNPGREFPGKLRISGSFSSRLFKGSAEHGDAGSSKITGGSDLK
ncbi:hypothetical protein BUALT_Bualt05G0147400 [Buddleja alternifolia]|uniref:RING-type domain-containing protein n=1 Tax=Buddleja alternifolia TaxID=168488 RepID=A0AAV6XV02_9LAMI|nr:hypothetical protein BUALT_Bualt05G0147400 [Buddleja alternifolia]